MVVASGFIVQHFEQNTQHARQVLRLVLEQIRLVATLESGLPEHVALLVVRVELARELKRLVETVEEREELLAAQVNVHAVLVVKQLIVDE
jgi:hypothetical protein